jgi:LPS export ABC transporter protein LptC
MNKKAIWIITAILLPVLAGLLIWGTWKESAHFNPYRNTKDEIRVNSEELIGLTMKIPGGSRNGYWELNCAKMVNASQFGTLATINGRYYSAHKPIYHLVAESGRIYWGDSILELRGKVKFSMNDGTELTAEEIIWNPQKNRISAKNNVFLTSHSLELKTEEMVAKLDFNTLTLKGMTQVSYKGSRGDK